MKVSVISEAEMDFERKRGRFFKIYPRTDSVSESFYDHQYKLINALEELLAAKFGSDETFVSDNVWPNHGLKIDIGIAILSDSLVCCLHSFLREKAPDYAMTCLVHESIKRGACYGRFILNLREIAVEQNLKNAWSERVMAPDFAL